MVEQIVNVPVLQVQETNMLSAELNNSCFPAPQAHEHIVEGVKDHTAEARVGPHGKQSSKFEHILKVVKIIVLEPVCNDKVTCPSSWRKSACCSDCLGLHERAWTFQCQRFKSKLCMSWSFLPQEFVLSRAISSSWIRDC